MLQVSNQASEDELQEASNYLEGCSPELVAACIPDYAPGVIAALLARWEPTFATAVRKLVDLNCWVHLVDGNSDLNLSVQWLLSDADISLAKQVVDRIGLLDRSRGEGMHRAAQLMKALRSAQTPRTIPAPTVAKPTSSTTLSAPLSSSTSADLSRPEPPIANPQRSFNFPRPPAIVVSHSAPKDEAQTPLSAVTTVPSPTSELLHPPFVDGSGRIRSREADVRPTHDAEVDRVPRPFLPTNSSSVTNLNAILSTSSTHPTYPGLPLNSIPPPLGPSATLQASGPSPNDPSGTRTGVQPSSPRVLPSRGKDHRGAGPGTLNQASTSFFSGTPVPKSIAQRSASALGEQHPGPTASPPAAPGGVVLPLAADPVSPPTGTPLPKSPVVPDSTALGVPSHDKKVLETFVDELNPEVKSKYTNLPNPHRRWSPSPRPEDNNSLGNDDDYLRGSSEVASALSDEQEKDSEQETEEEATEDDDDIEYEDVSEDDDVAEDEDEDVAEDEDDPDDDDEDVTEDEVDDLEDETSGPQKKKRQRRPKDVEVNTAWTWKKETNDSRVLEWELEKEVDSDPTVLHPARTKWMYEARLKDLSEEDYEDILRAEHQKLLKVPPACRSTVGKMYLKRAKGDWEVRVVLTCLTWRYTQVKIKKENAAAEGDKAGVAEYTAELTKILNKGMRDLFKRFPDLDPKHEKRQIAIKLGSAAVKEYLQTIRTKVSSDAGRMSTAYRLNGGTIGMLESKSAGQKALGLLDILGKKRRDVAFHLWGGSSSGGRDKCDKQIKKRMDKWKALHLSSTPRETSNESLQVVCEVRKTLFEKLLPNVQQEWEERAKNLHLPQTEEERQCLVDAVLPYLFRLLTRLSQHSSLHFILFASGQGTSNVPVIGHEFSESTVDQESFFDENPALAQRVRSDYLKYAIARHNTGQEEVVEGLPVMHTPDASREEASADAQPGRSEKAQKVRGPITPFQPNLSVIKTRSQRVTYMSKWFISAGTQILGHKPSWDYLCKNMAGYIVSGRMPADPLVEGKALEIGKPSAMADARFDALWRFLLDSYSGNLPPERRFMFQVDVLHQSMPLPPAPGDEAVHQAAINSTKTLPMKKGAAKDTSKRAGKAKKGPLNRSHDDLLDAAGIAEDEDAALLDMALADQPKPTRKRLTRSKRRVESPEVSGDEGSLPQGPKPREADPPGGEPHIRKTPRDGSPAGGHHWDAAPGAPPPDRASLPTKGQSLKSDSGKSIQLSESDEGADQNPPTNAGPVQRRRPRPRGVLPPATDTLRHSSFPAKHSNILQRWQNRLQDLVKWGRRMGVGVPQGKVLRYRGFAKKEWTSLLPTGLDAAFSILQMWSACQDKNSAVPPLSVPLAAGLEGVTPTHPVAVAINAILDSQKNLPTVKVLNVQFGTSPAANDGFFDFVEGTLIAFVQEALQSEEVFMDGAIDVMQLLRLATFVGGTGFIRDFSAVSVHTTRTSLLVDRVNVLLASMALIRYHHVVLGGAISAFCDDQAITGAEKDMWSLLMQTWGLAVRTMARAIVQHRSDLFDRKRLSNVLPEVLDHMLEPSLALRPWWIYGETGLPAPISFTTKQSVASSCLYKTLSLLDWSSLTLLERSQYLLLVFLAAVQIRKGRIPQEATPVGVLPRAGVPADSKAMRGMTAYLRGLQAVIAGSNEIGEFGQPPADRLTLPNVQENIARWQSESRNPGVIAIRDQEMEDRAPSPTESRPPPATFTAPSAPEKPASTRQGQATSSLRGNELQGGTDGPVVGDSRLGSPRPGLALQLEQEPMSELESPSNDVQDHTNSSIAGDSNVDTGSSGLAPQLEQEPTSEMGSPSVQQNVSDASFDSVLLYEPEDSIWPEGEGPARQARGEEVIGFQIAAPPGENITPAPEPTEPAEPTESVIPAVRSRPPSPSAAPKAKRQRLIPETPSHWRTDEQGSDGRRLRSNRLPAPPQSSALATTATGSNAGRRKKLTVVTETQQAGLKASQRQPSRSKRPPA